MDYAALNQGMTIIDNVVKMCDYIESLRALNEEIEDREISLLKENDELEERLAKVQLQNKHLAEVVGKCADRRKALQNESAQYAKCLAWLETRHENGQTLADQWREHLERNQDGSHTEKRTEHIDVVP